jgi:hypothetical protein
MENTKDVKPNAQRRDEPLGGKQVDSEFEEAVDRVYRKYGSDLAEFVRDVQKDLQKKAAHNQDCLSQRPFLL